MTNELYHHGILGQRWGVRRYQNEDGSLTSTGKKHMAENYSKKQQRYDEQVYNRGAVRRINKKLLDGDGIATARSYEANRINGFRKSAQTAGQIGGVIGGVAGGIGGFIGGQIAAKVLNDKLGTKITPEVAAIGSGIIAAGAASASKSLGYMGGRSITMLAGGYRPNQYR